MSDRVEARIIIGNGSFSLEISVLISEIIYSHTLQATIFYLQFTANKPLQLKELQQPTSFFQSNIHKQK